MRRPPILVAALAWVAFAILAVLVEPGPVLFDEGLLLTFASWRGESLDHVVVGITHLGGYVVQIVLGVGLGAVLLVRARPFGLFVATSLLGSFATNEGLKRLFGRPRPSLVDRITDPYGLSFPSGHSQATMAFCLTVVLVAQHHPAVGPRGRRLAWLLLVFPVVVGWSRSYLGVHYPTDVLAGWAFGAGWVLLCYAAYLPQLAPLAAPAAQPAATQPAASAERDA
ncbi:MAG: phosphatase PAP2 family protein [Myxococcota bacterium]|jgi:undecaprenyl-diphosphatase|nr:phosphatase PAP2 family protein [Myxococcota bacterium]